MQRILLVGLASLASLAASPANSQLRADAGFGAMGLEGCRTDLRYLNRMFGWQVNWAPEWRALGQASDAELEDGIKASVAAGFYRPPQGGKSAAYVINLSRPQDRRLMAEVIAFHETLPGHHVGAGLGLPAGTFNSGFLEGWGIYSEYLADEMGLYGSSFDRTGMMAKHLWAASRLVIEPGLHLHGWTRQQAIDFMRLHTALAVPKIELEIDRYISTPGQSLSYMLGYDRIADARAYAKKQLGSRFDVRDFHDVVLGKGVRPLDEMRADVVRRADSKATAKI